MTLEKIINSRQMKFSKIKKENVMIGKPRFIDPKYNWQSDSYLEVKTHFKQIKTYFETHNFETDPIIHDYISYEGKKDKKSIIFLIESDVWATDEVYGDYLIDSTENEIYHYRRGEKRTKLNYDGSNMTEFIIHDARNQIIQQLKFLWNTLLVEIEICMSGDHLEMFGSPQTDDEIASKIVKLKDIISIDPEVALLQLGRLEEHWCALQANKNKINYLYDLINEFFAQDKINNYQKQVLHRIRSAYNLIKHDRRGRTSIEQVNYFYDEFSKITGIYA